MEYMIKEEIIEDTELENPNVNWDQTAGVTSLSFAGEELVLPNTVPKLEPKTENATLVESDVFIDLPLEKAIVSDQHADRTVNDAIELKYENDFSTDMPPEASFTEISNEPLTKPAVKMVSDPTEARHANSPIPETFLPLVEIIPDLSSLKPKIKLKRVAINSLDESCYNMTRENTDSGAKPKVKVDPKEIKKESKTRLSNRLAGRKGAVKVEPVECSEAPVQPKPKLKGKVPDTCAITTLTDELQKEDYVEATPASIVEPSSKDPKTEESKCASSPELDGTGTPVEPDSSSEGVLRVPSIEMPNSTLEETEIPTKVHLSSDGLLQTKLVDGVPSEGDTIDDETVMLAKDRIISIAATIESKSSKLCDIYAEFEEASSHPNCKYTLEELKVMAQRIPSCLGDEHRLSFVRECYQHGRDPNKWEWELYSEIEPLDKPESKLSQQDLKEMAKGVLTGEKRGDFVILAHHRGEDPDQLLRKLSKDPSPPFFGRIYAKHKWADKYIIMSKGFPHRNCKFTLKELKQMADHIPEAFGVETRMKFIYRCYRFGKDPTLEDWTQYAVNPYYEFEDLFPHNECKHSIEELKRMAEERIPESLGPQARGIFFQNCFMRGCDPEKEDWRRYKIKPPKLLLSNPWSTPHVSDDGDNPYSEFCSIDSHKKCKYPLEKVITMAEQIPASFGIEARVHFVRRCYKFGHDINKESKDWSRYFEPALIHPPIVDSSPYAEFDDAPPHPSCQHSLGDIKKFAGQIPELFGVEVRVKFVRRCYFDGKDPTVEDWTKYNLDPYFETKELPVNKKNRYSYDLIKKIAEQQIPKSAGILPRLLFVRRCYALGKNPYQEDWKQYDAHHYTLLTRGRSSSKEDDPFDEFKWIPPHSNCKHSLEQLKQMAAKIPESLPQETRAHFVRRCYRFGHDPETEDWNKYFQPLVIHPPVDVNNPYAEFNGLKPHPNCKLNIEQLSNMAKKIPQCFGIETRVKFIRHCFKLGKNPAVEDWTLYNIDPFSELEGVRRHKKCRHTLEELKKMSERIHESYGIRTRLAFVTRCYKNGMDPNKEDWTKYTVNTYNEFDGLPPHKNCNHSLEELKCMAERLIPERFMDARVHYIRRCYKDGKDPAKEDWKQYPSVCSTLTVLSGGALEGSADTRKKKRIARNVPTKNSENQVSHTSGVNDGWAKDCQSTNSYETPGYVPCPPQVRPNLIHPQFEARSLAGVQCSNPTFSKTYAEFTSMKPHPDCKHSLAELISMAEQMPESLGLGARIHFIRECYQFGKPRVLQVGPSAHNSKPVTKNFGVSPSLGPNVEGMGGNPNFSNAPVAPAPSLGPGKMWNEQFGSTRYPYTPLPSDSSGLHPLQAAPNSYPSVNPSFQPGFPPSGVGEMSFNPANYSANFTPPIGIPPGHTPGGQCPQPAPPFMTGYRGNYQATPPPHQPPFSGPPSGFPPRFPSPNMHQFPQATPTIPPMGDPLYAYPPAHHNMQPVPTGNRENPANRPATGNQFEHYPHFSNVNNIGSNATVSSESINRPVSKQEESMSKPKNYPLSSQKRKSNPEPIPTTNVTTRPKTKPAGFKDLTVYVVHSGYPNMRLSREQMDILENDILEAVLEVDDTSVKPTFIDSFRTNGQYGFVCADDFTKNWLSEFLSSYQPWQNMSLMLLSSLPKIRADVVLPLCKDDDTKILKFIGKQNSKLNTDQWTVVERWDSSDSKTRMVFMIDEESANTLETSKHIHFKLGSGQVTISPRTVGEPQEIAEKEQVIGAVNQSRQSTPGATVSPPPDVSSLKYELMKLKQSRPPQSPVVSSSTPALPSNPEGLREGDNASGRGNTIQSTKSSAPVGSPSPDKSSLKYELLKLRSSLPDKCNVEARATRKMSSASRRPSDSGDSVRITSPDANHRSSSESDSSQGEIKRKDSNRRQSWRVKDKRRDDRYQEKKNSEHDKSRVRRRRSSVVEDDLKRIYGSSSSGRKSTRRKRERSEDRSSSKRSRRSSNESKGYRSRHDDPLGIRSNKSQSHDRGKKRSALSPVRLSSPEVSSRSEGECTPSPTGMSETPKPPCSRTGPMIAPNCLRPPRPPPGHMIRGPRGFFRPPGFHFPPYRPGGPPFRPPFRPPFGRPYFF